MDVPRFSQNEMGFTVLKRGRDVWTMPGLPPSVTIKKINQRELKQLLVMK